MIVFEVAGIPQPKGSTRAYVKAGRPIVTSDNPKIRDWSRTIHYHARSLTRRAVVGPVALSLVFYLPRPRRAHAGDLPIHRPDVDKLVRGVLDALTGAIYRDDGQVVNVTAAKRYTSPGDEPRVSIEAYDLPNLGVLNDADPAILHR